MIPRLFNCFHHGFSQTFTQAARLASRPFSSTSSIAAVQTHKQRKKRYRDPYAEKQAQARRAANLSRQTVLRQERAEALGSSIRGVTTPFVESFDTAAVDLTSPTSYWMSRSQKALPGTEESAFESSPFLNHFLTPLELRESLQSSRRLTTPLPPQNLDTADPATMTAAIEQHAQEHATASVALARIVSLANGSSADRTKANIRRCIDTFGRHKTDGVVPPKPMSAASLSQLQDAGGDAAALPAIKARGGADTGSSEVQIAILTARIRNVANAWETTGRKDKVNKRNLRLLLHRRQKLLNYLRRKERGGGRWTHLVEKLGLTGATWEGQIEVR